MKKYIIFLLKAIWAIIGFVAIYALCALLIPYIEIPAEKTTEPKTKELFLLTNGVHTDLVVPIKSTEIDWSTEIPFENTLSKKTDFKYIAIGYGDKGSI